MTCPVCLATRPPEAGTVCRLCGWDDRDGRSQDSSAVLAARDAFRARTTAYAPQTRVTAADRRLPWMGLVLGLALVVVVLFIYRVVF